MVLLFCFWLFCFLFYCFLYLGYYILWDGLLNKGWDMIYNIKCYNSSLLYFLGSVWNNWAGYYIILVYCYYYIVMCLLILSLYPIYIVLY